MLFRSALAARAYSLDVQEQLAAVQAEHAAMAAERDQRTAAAQAANASMAQAQAEANDLRARLAQAAETIRLMESSAFWRLRKLFRR